MHADRHLCTWVGDSPGGVAPNSSYVVCRHVSMKNTSLWNDWRPLLFYCILHTFSDPFTAVGEEVTIFNWVIIDINTNTV